MLKEFIRNLNNRRISGATAVAAIFLIGLATVTLAVEIYRFGFKPVAPNVSESKPKAAAGCCAKKFTVTQQLIATPTPFAACPGCVSNVVFQSNRDGNWEIYRAMALISGPGQTRLTNNAASDMAPVWLASGQLIAFQSNRDGNWEIYTMDNNGGNQKNVTNSSYSDEMAPSLSCRYLYFQSNRDGNWEIYRANIDGSNQTRLTNNYYADLQPAVSKDENVVFQSNRDGNWEIYFMNYDGTGVQRLTNTTWDEMNPAWSPDGNWIVFQTNKSGTWKLAKVNKYGNSYTELPQPTYGRSPVWYPYCNNMIFFQTDREINWTADGNRSKPTLVIKSYQMSIWQLFDSPDLPSGIAAPATPTSVPVATATLKPAATATPNPTATSTPTPKTTTPPGCAAKGGVCCLGQAPNCQTRLIDPYVQDATSGGCSPDKTTAHLCCKSCLWGY